LKGEWAEARGESFDYTGGVLYAVMLIILISGVTSLPSVLGAGMTVVGIVGIALFFRRQARVQHPMFSVELLTRNRVFALSSLAAFMSYAATSAVLFLLSLYLQSVKGMSAKATGTLLVSQPIVQTIFTPFAGRISDRVEPRLVASAGMAITVVGLILFAFCSVQTPLLYIVFVLCLMGLGFALFAAPNANAVMGSVDRRFYGVASGALATTRTIGQCLSMSVTGLILALYLGRHSTGLVQPGPFISALRLLFPIFAALCAIGVFASLGRGKLHAGEEQAQPAR
jgi:MFS family permease